MPPDRYQFDLQQPHPNVDIEAVRRLVVQLLAGVDDAYWLTGLLSTLLADALALATAAAEERDQLRADLDELTDRVTALEVPPIIEGAAL